MIEAATTAEGLNVLREVILDVRVGMLTTWRGDEAHSRPMYTQDVTADGELIFLTSSDGALVRELQRRDIVLLAYADTARHRYASVSGRGVLLDDPTLVRELWTPGMKAWFPDGADDPRLRVLTVMLEEAEFWEAPSAPVRLFSFLKALTTHRRPDDGRHGHIVR